MNIERLEFQSVGERLVGHLFLPDGDPVACAVITGPSTSVKEQASGAYAQALAARGFLSLAFGRAQATCRSSPLACAPEEATWLPQSRKNRVSRRSQDSRAYAHRALGKGSCTVTRA